MIRLCMIKSIARITWRYQKSMIPQNINTTTIIRNGIHFIILLAYTHFNAEGEIEFKSILFLPKKAPFDMMDNYWTKKSEVKLYVRRVLVAEKFEELLPRYLNFVRGVVPVQTSAP